MTAEKLKQKLSLVAGEEARGERLDLYLVRCVEGVSRKAVKKALDAGQVFVDGKSVRRASFLLEGGEKVVVTLEAPPKKAEAPPIEVLHRDSHVLAVNKPAGIDSHPTGSGRPDALSLAAELHGGSVPPVLLHRLDLDTSGLLLFALDGESNRDLARQFSDRALKKTYLCLVRGNPLAEFRVEKRLKPGPRGRTLAVETGGKEALTDFRTLASSYGLSLVEASPRTGRTHQIRVHLARMGFPLLGDRLYGGPASVEIGDRQVPVHRHMLHASSLDFRHPGTQKPMTLQATLPEDFRTISEGIEGFRRHSSRKP